MKPMTSYVRTGRNVALLLLLACISLTAACKNEVVDRCKDLQPVVADEVITTTHSLECSELGQSKALHAWAEQLSVGVVAMDQRSAFQDLEVDLDEGVTLRKERDGLILTHSRLGALRTFTQRKLPDALIAYQFEPVLDPEFKRREQVNLQTGRRKPVTQPQISDTGSYWRAFKLADERVDIGEYISDITIRLSPRYDRPTMALELTDEGAEALLELTRNHVGKRVAILHGEDLLVSAPVVNEAVSSVQVVFPFGAMSQPKRRGAPIIAEGLAEEEE